MSGGGHPNALDYSPRQISGFLELASAREKIEAANTLSLNTLAARGDPKDLKKQHEALTR
jgi:hypothetical protein